MKHVRVDLNLPGFTQLRNDPRIVADLRRRAAAVAKAAGDGYDYDVETGATRARAAVYTVSDDAKKDTATTGALLRALYAGR